MKEVTKRSVEEKKAYLQAKARIVEHLPSPYEISTLEDYAKSYWRYDEEQYANDAEYRETIKVAWANECLERKAYNEVLDSIYGFLLS